MGTNIKQGEKMSVLFPINRYVKNHNNIISDVDNFFTNIFDVYNNPVSRSTGTSTFPRANTYKYDAGYEIELAAPGLTRDEFEIQIDDNTLTISANTSSGSGVDSSAEDNRTATMREFSYSNFTRSWTLPSDVNRNGVDARYEAGMLKIFIPVEKEKNTTTRIEVS